MKVTALHGSGVGLIGRASLAMRTVWSGTRTPLRHMLLKPEGRGVYADGLNRGTVFQRHWGPGAQLGFLRKLPQCPTQMKVNLRYRPSPKGTDTS